MSKASSQKFIGRNRPPRVQIEYEVEEHGSSRSVELPFTMAVMSNLKGDLQDGESLERVEDREFTTIDIDQGIDGAMRSVKPRAKLSVENKIDNDGSQLAVDLQFKTMADFKPDKIAKNVPELNKLLDTRNQLKALLTMMDGRTDASERIAELLENPDLMKALGKMEEDKTNTQNQGET